MGDDDENDDNDDDISSEDDDDDNTLFYDNPYYHRNNNRNQRNNHNNHNNNNRYNKHKSIWQPASYSTFEQVSSQLSSKYNIDKMSEQLQDNEYPPWTFEIDSNKNEKNQNSLDSLFKFLGKKISFSFIFSTKYTLQISQKSKFQKNKN